jgi:5-methylcytosine-specific restriction endonuclease McrA
MKSRTPKRTKQEAEYKKLCDEIDKEAKEKGEYRCFFCGKDIKGRADHHHLDGRENEHLLDRERIVLAHNQCHVQEYHGMSVRKQSWREVFMDNLRAKDLRLYFKEREKENK